MRKRRPLGAGGVIFVLLVVLAAIALALLPMISLNPSGTDAVIFGTPNIIGGDDGAFLTLQPHARHPLAVPEEGLFIHHNPPVHQICFRAAGENICCNATQVP